MITLEGNQLILSTNSCSTSTQVPLSFRAALLDLLRDPMATSIERLDYRLDRVADGVTFTRGATTFQLDWSSAAAIALDGDDE